ncbi:TldD/PmbA family protein [Prochlorococcus marinus]|uniref:Peptidase C69 n=1 Tax=Prochlorococcus marinus XMU1408 TaxID=2213228 RepID=A0A318R4R6_PROMR|nr:TldD/PmbA family protein [Prochlorococcus marinus]MBW3041997.1 peptidase C69 [Prochlorococcus marinus str. XMU1408]PYE03120.1 peptidase C69 [Prochlorococcus marinus XMU1408]
MMTSENKTTIGELNPALLNNLLEKYSKESKISKWDLGASSSKDISVQVQDGNAKQLKGSQRNSLTLRVWNTNNKVGITSTSDLTSEGIKKAMKGAIEASRFGNYKETPEFSSLAKSPLKNIKSTVKNNHRIDELLSILKQAEKKLIETHKSIDSVPYNGLSENYIERLYINSDGANRYMKLSQSSIYLYAKAQEKNKKPRSAGGIRINSNLEELDIEACIDETSNKLISHLNYQPIETKKYLICFTPDAFLQLINAFSSMFNARSIIDGLSLMNEESLGTLVAVKNLNISDEGLHPENVGAFSFDGEGTPTQNINLIKSGVLLNLIHSEATARKFGVNPTGHAGLGAKVSVSPDWLVVSKSDNEIDKDETLSVKTTLKEYILIDELSALHSGVKASQGSFSLPFDGWIVKDGKKTSIEAATVAGDILKVLKNIIKIENEQIVTHQGISPHIWVDNISITGEA